MSHEECAIEDDLPIQDHRGPVSRQQSTNKSPTVVRTIHRTTNEWYKAVQLGDSCWLYVLWDPRKTPSPEPLRIQNPAKQLDHAKKEVVAARFFDLPPAAVEAAAEKEARR